jgi:hypothetical protein
MIEKTGDIILQEYEYLFGAAKAQSQNKKEHGESFLNDIRKDLSREYNDNVDEKIQRWIDVTRVYMFFESRAVEFFIQSKMLYRDGFFEATIMMCRCTCEMVCYDLLDSVVHQFGNRQEVEKVNFRKLVKHLFKTTNSLSQTSFDLMNGIYDIGNNYIHPKVNQNPKVDSKKCVLDLGTVLYETYGVKPHHRLKGKTVKTAYTAFPNICKSYHLVMDVFLTPEAAAEDAKRYS